MVETQIVWLPTYVSKATGKTYSGDKQDPEDYDVTGHMHPFDGQSYKYLPEEQNWELDVDAKWEEIRDVRDRKIDNFAWKIARQRDLIDLGTAPAETLTPLLEYVQALRDVPQTQTDPFNIVWPLQP